MELIPISIGSAQDNELIPIGMDQPGELVPICIGWADGIDSNDNGLAQGYELIPNWNGSPVN
jgi:hypothetical protein